MSAVSNDAIKGVSALEVLSVAAPLLGFAEAASGFVVLAELEDLGTSDVELPVELAVWAVVSAEACAALSAAGVGIPTMAVGGIALRQSRSIGVG